VGSLNLEEAVTTLKRDLVELTGQHDLEAECRNQQTATRWLLAIIYAQFFVFCMFLECAQAQPGGIIEDHKQLWLFMQAIPTSYFCRDIFHMLSQIIHHMHPTGYDDGLNGSIALEQMTIREILGSSTIIFTALNEMQELTNKLRNHFRSAQNPTQPQPNFHILLPILILLLHLIVLGTGLSIWDLDEIYSSVVAKDGPESLTFTYLRLYFLEDFLTVELAGRMAYWLHGQ
jgi:hypothetical protein